VWENTFFFLSRYASKQYCHAVSAGVWAGQSDHLSQIIQCRWFQ